MRDRNAPGRPREFDETEMLRKIMSLFWRAGYEGVSLSRIMTETGLQKASLYAAFGDKRSMYLKALALYHSDVVSAAANGLTDTARPPRERIEAFLSSPLVAAEKGDRSGCFLCNASADQADQNDETKRQVSLGFERLLDGLVTALQALELQVDATQLRARAAVYLGLYSGFRIMVRSGVPVAQLRASIDEALRLLRAD